MSLRKSSQWVATMLAALFVGIFIRQLFANPVPPDPDNDGLTTAQEIAIGTNPYNPDSDGDGVNDGIEVFQGRNPKSTSLPGAIADTNRLCKLQVFTPLK